MITEQQVRAAQAEWAKGIVAIGKAQIDGGDYAEMAGSFIDRMYAYQIGTVLFKPTRASVIAFRGTKEGALSYFIGNNPGFPEDKGFALQPWTHIRFDNTGIITGTGYVLTMGYYYLTTLEGEEVKVEYTIGFIKDNEGNLRINLHHSSFPYQEK